MGWDEKGRDEKGGKRLDEMRWEREGRGEEGRAGPNRPSLTTYSVFHSNLTLCLSMPYPLPWPMCVKCIRQWAATG